MSETLQSVGRRKNAVAQVRLVPGTGQRTVNGKQFRAYFDRDSLVDHTEAPLSLTNLSVNYDVVAVCRGGGKTGQAGAVRLGIARCLVKADGELKKPLRGAGFLTRDSRMVERKKYGQRGARCRFQFSKR
ncbi:MAG: 30S ribosomal protein S9 [Gemmatimonadota bacterium]|nr:MAG: 30S ribosomal protein S9 [Gemmatimonadota bacterium]